MRHTVGVRQSVILTRKLYYAAFCQGAIMSFYSTMRLGVALLDVALLSVMRHFTIPPSQAHDLILPKLMLAFLLVYLGT